MKRLLLIGLLACFVAGAPRADTAVPPLVNYQGMLTDENGTAIPDGMKKLEFNLYDAPLAGNRVWGPQVFDNVPVVNGRFNVILGTTDTGGRSISSAFATSQRYLGFKVGAVGANLAAVAEISPRQQILSTAFAIHALTADRVDFPNINTDWGSISFQSTGDEAHASNMFFDTYDNGNEGFIFRTTGTERARIDETGVRTASIYAVDRMHIFGGELLFILNSGGAIVSRAWGGTGNLSVEGSATVNCRICLGWADDNGGSPSRETCVSMTPNAQSPILQLGGKVDYNDRLWLFYRCP